MTCECSMMYGRWIFDGSNAAQPRLAGSLGLIVLSLAGAMLSGCMVGPDYVKPKVQVPATYKESEGWKIAEPQDHLARGKWWEVYGDPQLNALEEQVVISNQNVAVAAAQFRQARSLVQAARSAYFPTLTVGASATRAQQSSTLGTRPVAKGIFNDFLLPLDVSWEVDIWGKFRRALESAQASAQASAGDLEAVKLSAQAELAQDYFQLRSLDGQKQLLDETVIAYEKSLQLTKNRYAAGVVSKADIAFSQTLLKTTQAQAVDLGVQRAQFEHAIAVLIGKPPSGFSLPAAPLTLAPPPVPAGVPSALLERRPDVAAAERRVAAANAQIGVAIAAYYPSLTLSASIGFETTNLSQWLTAPSKFWALGPASVSETVFDGGARQAQTAQARAIYDAGVATYRQTVLTGFQEVEDNLAALRILEQEASVQDDAVKAAVESVALTTNQYKAGTVSFLDVVVAQTAALNNERTAVDILGRRVTASVLLVKALGGGWSSGELPSPEELMSGRSSAKESSAQAVAGTANNVRREPQPVQ